MKFVFTIVVLLGSLVVSAQNDPLFSHYLINPLYQHPGWAGVEEQSHVSAIVRSQWTGYNSSFDGPGGNPNTQFINAFFSSQGAISGIGLSILNDNLGPLNNTYVNFPIAKRFEIGFGYLSVGVMPGFISQTFQFNKLRFNDPSDPFNVGSQETEFSFNLGAGVVYQSRSNTFIALSVNSITEPGFDYGFDTLNFDNNLNRSYSVLAGKMLRLNRDFTITPNIQVRTDLNTFTFDVGGLVRYGERGWGGLSYRWSEAVSLLLGYSFLAENQLQVGYAFDYVTNEREAKQFTSQELFIRYALPDITFGGRKQVKTPRFTY